MTSILNAARTKLQAEYAAARARISEHLNSVLRLVGQVPLYVKRRDSSRPNDIPISLGSWRPKHSQLVRTMCPELEPELRRIEEMLVERGRSYIRGQHVRQRPGPKRGAQRPGPLNSYQEHELMGEWPTRKL